MIRIFAIALVSLAAVSVCLAGDAPSNLNKAEITERFMRAFMAEDAEALSQLTSGELQSDFRKYFWFRSVMHNGEKPSVAPRAVGAVRMDIENKGRVETMSADLRSNDKADCYRVVIAGDSYIVCVDDLGKVVSVDADGSVLVR
jgi:hypothetical protein